MAFVTKKYCDRCGKEIKGVVVKRLGHFVKGIKKVNTFTFVYEEHNDDLGNDFRAASQFDLCEDCTEKLFKFLHERKNNDV